MPARESQRHLRNRRAVLQQVAAREGGIASQKYSPYSYIALLFPAADAAQTLLLSNMSDGWMTLGNAIAVTLKTGVYRFSFTRGGLRRTRTRTSSPTEAGAGNQNGTDHGASYGALRLWRCH